MTREEFDDLLVTYGGPDAEWDTRFKILREYDRLATEKDDLRKRLEDATGEIAHLKDTRQDPFDQIEVLRVKCEQIDTALRVAKAEVMENEETVLSIIRRREEYRYDAERLANFIKHAQMLGLFRGTSHIAAQAIDVLNKHQKATWEEEDTPQMVERMR